MLVKNLTLKFPMSDAADPADDEAPGLRGLAHDSECEVHQLG